MTNYQFYNRVVTAVSELKLSYNRQYGAVQLPSLTQTHNKTQEQKCANAFVVDCVKCFVSLFNSGIFL